MDNLTHALVGVTMSRAVAGTVQRSPLWWVFLIASEIPDIDVLYMLQGHNSYLINHRGWTHSLPGLVLLSLGVALLFRLLARGGGRLRDFWPPAALASSVHVILDALTSWGTGLLHPFQANWVYLDILPIVDPVVWGILLIGLLAARFRPFPSKAAKITLAAMLIFIAARGALHYTAVNSFGGAGSAGRLLATPTLDPLKWRVVIEQPWGFELGSLSLFPGYFEKLAELQTSGPAAVAKHTSSRDSAAIINFFRIPVCSAVEDEGNNFFLVKDLSYGSGIREVLLETDSPAEPGVWYKVIK